MLIRIVVLLVVIALVIVYVRKRHQRKQPAQQQKNPGTWVPASNSAALEQFLGKARENSPQASASLPWQTLVIVLGVLVISAGGIYSYLYWQDQQRLVTVLLHRDAASPPVIYRVAKRNLGEGSFITEDGTRVTVSTSERMEVVGL